MLKIECFKAGKGDSFLLSWGNNFQSNLLVDAGIEGTYRFIRQRLVEGIKLNAILITHVDYDHIGGFFKLLNDVDYKPSEDLKVFLNTPTLLLYPSDSNKVGIEHGIEFEQILHKKGISPISLFLGKTEQNHETIEGLNLTILSPNQDTLKKLLEEWTADAIYQKYQIENRSVDGLVTADSGKLKSIADILEKPTKPKAWEDDLLNSSSISFIASHENVNILFLGDSNPDLICEELERLGFTKSRPLVIDLIKISHHGSKHNTTKELLERLDCKQYLISTDGSAPYHHPNRETLILISEYGRTNKEIPLKIYTNYPLDLTNKLTDEEQLTLKINFEVVNQVEFPLL